MILEHCQNNLTKQNHCRNVTFDNFVNNIGGNLVESDKLHAKYVLHMFTYVIVCVYGC